MKRRHSPGVSHYRDLFSFENFNSKSIHKKESQVGSSSFSVWNKEVLSCDIHATSITLLLIPESL
jgi:hypothetical protein